MFAVVACGRLVQTDFQQVDASKFTLTVPAADKVNHLVFFLTGQCPLPEGAAAAIYLGWPQQPPSPPDPVWSYVGHLTNEKPSAIFKIARTRPADHDPKHPFEASHFGNGGWSDFNCVQVGISVEPMAAVADQTAPSGTRADSAPAMLAFSQRMLESLVNYLSSFAVTPAGAAESYVPMSAVTRWYETFERRLKQFPDFWKS